MTSWLKDLEVDEISFVDKGASGDAAHRPAVVLLKRKDGTAPAWSMRLPIVKLDEEKRLATGWAMIAADASGRTIVDYQGDKVSADDLEKAAHRALKSATAGDMHERSGLGEIVESMVITAEKRDALGFGTGPSGWAVTLKVSDDALWRDAKAGKKLELSIGGRATRVADAAKGAGAIIDKVMGLFRKSLEQVVKDGGEVEINVGGDAEEAGMDLSAIMAKLTPEEQKMLQEALAAGAKKPDAPAPDAASKALAELPAEVQKQLEADKAEKAELQKRLEKLEADNETKVFVEKAAAYKWLPGSSVEKMGGLLRKVSKSISAEEFAELEKMLASAAEVVRKSALLQERGSAQSAEGSALAKIDAVAKSLREKDPSLTQAVAKMKAIDMHPELHAQFNEEAK